ncbi:MULTISPECIES: (d)CMP kinase [unclassified Undibacterium]|uniref:(d)CMP kinase n=1 Tax=unclassified Undibacterium TaxID=2630295 RepID=UPI002AC97D30|nr:MULTISPECIES: (d)CMP kinase [unclassified Undibacterium]MEB0139557.1 (d)CMP kinase [Undibacterium sp. CCC2.1]MEB0172512.1 (d)CMP kinase [Undibacterium sp. CCC1.1]MEB0176530.1 (d)CMP kinase [Undibacterium sp. CCC3.4]MEB0215616.1 (d)CMP kinase [Undibacterium sp. 5I2]WPX43986.1 (d)CMP kinase [Undibacterium sp. CCC3.4]
MSMLSPVITIDGPTASGKGTVAHRVAKHLGFHYLDSGALYRLTALMAQRHEVALSDAPAIALLARSLPCRFAHGHVLLEEQDVTDLVRAEAIGVAASRIAVLPEVRKALIDLQVSFRQAPGLVADGRDMGSVIFPDASLKVFLTASAEARAGRRYKQLIEKGISANMENLVKDLTERDARDSERAAAPLKPAPGAKILDTSDMTAEQAVEQVLQSYAQVLRAVQ